MGNGLKALLVAAALACCATAASAKTCEERFAAQGLSLTGLVANAPVTFEGNEYFVRPGETPQGLCAKADRDRSLIATKDRTIQAQKAQIAQLTSESNHFKELAGSTNYFKRHVYLGWMGWPVAAILVIIWTSVSVGIFIGKRHRR